MPTVQFGNVDADNDAEEEVTMCLSCGCGKPHDDHGNPDHITYEDLKKAADANGISVEQAANNIMSGLGAV